jgi:tetratricopeptide (TPR) repeat protein
MLGRSLEAEPLYRRAIAISTAGGTNTESASPMLLVNYARALSELNRLDQAAQFAEQAFEKAKRAGDDHVVNMSLSQRSTIYRKQGKLDRAGETLTEFEEKTKKLLPPEHVVFAIIASQKALLALARGEMETARVEADRSIDMAEKTAGTRLSFLLLRRAEVHGKSHRHDAARADAARVLDLEQKVAGVGGRTSGSGRAHLIMARAFNEQGKNAEARAEYAMALEHLRPCLGEEHPDTREAVRGAAKQ